MPELLTAAAAVVLIATMITVLRRRTRRAPEPAPAARFDARATCARCGARVSDNLRDICLADARRFGGKVYCYRHQRSLDRKSLL